MTPLCACRAGTSAPPRAVRGVPALWRISVVAVGAGAGIRVRHDGNQRRKQSRQPLDFGNERGHVTETCHGGLGRRKVLAKGVVLQGGAIIAGTDGGQFFGTHAPILAGRAA
jgi:hypothetical protein